MGVQVSSERLILVSAKRKGEAKSLTESFLAGEKFATTRAWKQGTIDRFKRVQERGEAVRVQTNYGLWTLLGWVTIASILGPGDPISVVSEEVVVQAGCAGWSKEEYIDVFCSREDPEKGRVPVDTVVCILFHRAWDRSAAEIDRLV